MRPRERFLDGFENLCLTRIPLPANTQWLSISRQVPRITSVYSRPRNLENSGWKRGKWHMQGLGFPVSDPFSHSRDESTKILRCFASYKHDSYFDTEIPSLSEWKIAPLGNRNMDFHWPIISSKCAILKINSCSKKNMLPIITWERPLHIEQCFMSEDDKPRILLGKERKVKNTSELESQEVRHPGINKPDTESLLQFTTRHSTGKKNGSSVFF